MLERNQPPNYRTLALRIVCILVAMAAIGSLLQSQPQVREVAQLQDLIAGDLTTDPLSADDHELVSGLAGTVSAMEWLGPLAPIAISPFFGLACLCGISQYGDGWLPLNAFVSDNPVLQNPAVLWAFVILTVVTSLPRLTKVSKPVGQAIDQLEAWSGIIAIIVIRIAAATSEPAAADATAMAAMPTIECGLFSMTADVLFSIAAIINIVVINTIKFFFEVSVWLMPFPFVDAMLEAANKSACAALMAVYAWSPFWATILNLVIFLACLFAFRWVKRQVSYMRSILFDPVWTLVQKSYGEPKRKELTVFPQQGIGPFAAREQLQLVDAGDVWELRQVRILLPSKTHRLPKSGYQMQIVGGMIVNKIEVAGGETPATLLFTRRFNDHLEKLAGLLGVEVAERNEQSSVSDLVIGT